MVAQSSKGINPDNFLDPPQPKPSKKEKKGFLSAAKSKASGTLRKTLFGKPPKGQRAKDAEDIGEEDDYTSSNYDTVRSLPASGHYGRSRVGGNNHSLHVDTLSVIPPVIVLKLPKRKPSTHLKMSPIGRNPVAQDPVFDFQAWHSALDNSELPFPFQRALFQSFDSMTIGSSIAAGDCNTIFFGRLTRSIKTYRLNSLFC